MAQEELTTLPVGRLGLVPLESCKSLGQKVDEWLVQWRKEREHSETDSFAFEGYKRDSYVVKVQNPRFGSGEGKCVVTESVRGRYLCSCRCMQLQYLLPHRQIHQPDVS